MMASVDSSKQIDEQILVRSSVMCLIFILISIIHHMLKYPEEKKILFLLEISILETID